MKRLNTILPFVIAIAFVIAGCDSILKGQEVSSDAAGELQARGIIPGQANVVEVTATHDYDANEHLFELSTDEVSSGWTTFEFTNASHSDHFVLLYEVPQAAIDAAEEANQSLLEHWYETVTVPFQEEFDPYIEDEEVDYGMFVENLVGAISESAPWFFDPGASPMGGPGLTAAGRTSEATVNLQSGTYIMECYVKDEDEEFHSYNGMLEQLTVTDEESGAREPRATMDVLLSSTDGIEIQEKVRPGKHIVAIQFEDQKTYGHLQGHNAHLVRLDDKDDEALLDDLAAWMDWREEDALAVRAPEGAEFLGGTMEMLGSETAYYTVNLKPGDYAWIAEVPAPDDKGMLKTFSVPSGRANGR